MLLRIEMDRGDGLGWRVRGEGEIPADTSMDRIRDQVLNMCLNCPHRAVLDGVVVFEHRKLTRREATKRFAAQIGGAQ